MADVNLKKLQTRIALKYDNYDAWQASTLKLLEGEVAICEIPSGVKELKDAAGNTIDVVQTDPTVLFKVGNGTDVFKDLPWASAKAADVYDWAKASDVTFDATAKTITFVGGNTDGTNRVFELEYLTETEVADKITAITESLDSRITALEGALGVDNGGEASVSGRLEALEDRMDDAEGAIDDINGVIGVEATDDAEASGLYAKIDAAKSAAIATAETDATEKANAAAEAANEYTDTAVETLNAKDAELVAEDERLAGLIESETEAREAADNSINAKLAGIGGTDEPATVAAAIETAKSAAIAAANVYTDGKVETLTGTVGEIQAAVQAAEETLTTLLGDDNNTSVRAIAAEETAKIVANADENYDTLKEIADWILNDTTGSAQMANDISALKAEFDTVEGKAGRVVVAEANIADLTERVEANTDAIEAIETAIGVEAAEGVNATGIFAKIDAAQAQANKGVQDAADARTDAANALTDAKAYVDEKVEAQESKDSGQDAKIGALEEAVENITKEETGAIATAVKTVTDIIGSDFTTTDTVAVKVAANAKAAEDAAQAAQAADEKAAAAQTDINTLKNETIPALDGRVAAIEDDYLKKEDFFFICCGGADDNDYDIEDAE